MNTTKIAIERAREKAMSRPAKVSNLAAEIEDALDEIVAARAEGLTLQDLSTEMSVPLKRLSEAVIRAKRKRAGLTSSGKPRRFGPPEYVSATARAFEASQAALVGYRCAGTTS